MTQLNLNPEFSLQERVEVLCNTLGIATGQSIEAACKNHLIADTSGRTHAVCQAMVLEGFMTEDSTAEATDGIADFKATPKGITYVNVILNWPFAEQAAAKAARRAKKRRAHQEAQQAIDEMLPALLSKAASSRAPTAN